MMLPLILIAIGILILLSLIPVPPLVILGPQGWQIKIPAGILLILIGVYLEYGTTLLDILGL